MATPHLQRLKPGQQPSAAEWNRLVDLVSRQGLATGTAFGDIGVAQGAGGIQILDGRDRGHWARIGARGTGAAYAHTHAAPDGDGTFTDLPQTSEYEWGTTTSAPAREVNGNEGVAEGTYAWVWPDPVGVSPGYLFAAGEGCCPWGQQYGLELGRNYHIIPGPNGTSSRTVVTQAMVRVPPGVQQIILRGNIAASWLPGGLFQADDVNATKRFVAANAYLALVTSGGAFLSQLNPGPGFGYEWNILSGCILPGADWETFPEGYHGDFTMQQNAGWIGSQTFGTTGFWKHGFMHGSAALRATVDFGSPLAEETFIAWRVQLYVYGWEADPDGGTLYVTGIGTGETWLEWEEVCCEPEADGPGAGSGSGSDSGGYAPGGAPECCPEETEGARLRLTADATEYILYPVVPGVWQTTSGLLIHVTCLGDEEGTWSLFVDGYDIITSLSASCGPFSLTFDGTLVGFSDAVTVEAVT